MEKPSKQVWRIMLGFDPNRQLKEMIFADMEREQLPIEVISQRYALPEIFILNSPADLIEYNGEKMTLDQFQARYPFRKFVKIT